MPTAAASPSRHSPSARGAGPQCCANSSATIASTPVCSCAPAANDCCGPTGTTSASLCDTIPGRSGPWDCTTGRQACLQPALAAYVFRAGAVANVENLRGTGHGPARAITRATAFRLPTACRPRALRGRPKSPDPTGKAPKKLLQEEEGCGTGDSGVEPTTQPDRRMRWHPPLIHPIWICQPFRRLASLIRADHLTSKESAIQQ